MSWRVPLLVMVLSALASCTATPPEAPTNVTATSHRPPVGFIRILDPDLDEDVTYGHAAFSLPDDQMQPIREHIEACVDSAHLPQGLGLTVWAHLTTDATGNINEVKLTGWHWHKVHRGDANKPERVMDQLERALSDPDCAKLPLPQRILGKNHHLVYRYYSKAPEEARQPLKRSSVDFDEIL